MFNYIKSLWNSFTQSAYDINYSQDIKPNPEATVVDISFIEFNRIKNLIEKHQSQIGDDFIITIESHPGAIGTTVIAKISNWVGTKTLIEENVTDHSNW